MVAQHCECNECHWFGHLKVVKMAYFMLYIFYYNKNFKRNIRKIVCVL